MRDHSVIDSLRAVATALLSGKFDVPSIVHEIDHAIHAISRDEISRGRAKQQLGILADMLDDGLQPIDESRAKFVGAEIRKYLEWI